VANRIVNGSSYCSLQRSGQHACLLKTSSLLVRRARRPPIGPALRLQCCIRF